MYVGKTQQLCHHFLISSLSLLKTPAFSSRANPTSLAKLWFSSETLLIVTKAHKVIALGFDFTICAWWNYIHIKILNAIFDTENQP